MPSAINILSTTLSTYQKVQDVEAANIASYGTNLPRKQVELSFSTTSGQVAGLILTGTSSATNEQLVKTMRDYQAQTAALQRRDDTNSQLEQRILGNPGQDASFFHSLNNMSSSLKTLAADAKSLAGAVFSIQSWAQAMVNAGNAVQDERQRADADIGSSVAAVNQLLQNIAVFNQQIAQSTGEQKTTLIDQRRSALHDLSAYVGIQIINGAADQTVDVVSTSQMQLVIGTQAASFLYSPAASSSASTVYDTVMFQAIGSPISTDATTFLTASNGRIAALQNIRDTFLPGVQEQLDVISQQTVAALNALHNQGTSLMAPAVLTGDVLPGNVRVTSGTAIAGAGTVRIGVLDKSTGNVTTVVDMDLSTMSTVNDILTAINGAGGGVTAAIVNGALVLTSSDPTKGVVVGHAASDSSEPSVGFSSGTSYTRGFSNFFGLNNLFSGVNQAPIAGFCQSLKLRSDIASSNGSGLSLTYALYPVSGSWSVGGQATGLVSDMSDLVDSAQITFPVTAEASSSTTTIRSYTLSFIDRQLRAIQINKNNLNNTSSILSGLSEKLNSQSGVDVQQEFMLLQQYAQNQKLIVAALAVIDEMLNFMITKL